MLTGLPSEFFFINTATMEFDSVHVNNQRPLKIPGLTVGALDNVLQHFRAAGTHFIRIQHLATRCIAIDECFVIRSFGLALDGCLKMLSSSFQDQEDENSSSVLGVLYAYKESSRVLARLDEIVDGIMKDKNLNAKMILEYLYQTILSSNQESHEGRVLRTLFLVTNEAFVKQLNFAFDLASKSFLYLEDLEVCCNSWDEV
jgi:hypothetical protein